MKKLFTGGRRKVAAVMAIALVASLSQVTTSGASGASTPKRGGNITVGIFDSFPGFCMADNLANSALMGGRTIYETWVEQRADGKIVPYILKSFESSADYKTWNLVVRDGIKFHDGSAFTADDVVFSFDRIRQPQGTMGIYVSGVKEMKKVDDHTLEVILDKPNPTLLNNFTTFYIMSDVFKYATTACKSWYDLPEKTMPGTAL